MPNSRPARHRASKEHDCQPTVKSNTQSTSYWPTRSRPNLFELLVEKSADDDKGLSQRRHLCRTGKAPGGGGQTVILELLAGFVTHPYPKAS